MSLPVGNGKKSEKAKVPSWDVLSAIKMSILIVMKAFLFGLCTCNHYGHSEWRII